MLPLIYTIILEIKESFIKARNGFGQISINKESDISLIPPPISSYGFQKLAVEYFQNLRINGLEYSIASI